jgi:glycosyltransferase involved in cell wall biosynthesis
MSAPTKVLMLVDSLRQGGAERFLVGLATNLPSDRYEVTVCATRSHDGPLKDELLAAGVRYVELGRKGSLDFGAFRQLLKLLRDERFDVLHAHKFGSNLWGSVFGRLARVPVIVAHEQTWSYEGEPLRRFLDGKVIARAAGAIVAVSTRDQERMTTVEGIPPSKTRYIPNAFMPPAGRPEDGDLRAELGIAPGTPLAGTLCVHRVQKALDVLIDAFAIVAGRIPDAELVMGGEGITTDALKAQAEALGIGQRVHWIGRRTDGAVVLDAYDVCALSSDYEGTPLLAFECIAAGTPMVATDVGGFRDIFESGRSALLVPPQNPEAMADALEELLRSPERRREVAAAAAERLGEFTVERAVERVSGLYEELLAAKRGGRRGRRRERAAAQAA